jgi:hypothetical protein
MKRTLTFLTALFVALAPMLLSPIAQATVATTSNKTVVSGDAARRTLARLPRRLRRSSCRTSRH